MSQPRQGRPEREKKVIRFAGPAWSRIGLGAVELTESTRRHAGPFVESFGHVLRMLESCALGDGIQSQVCLGQEALDVAEADAGDLLSR